MTATYKNLENSKPSQKVSCTRETNKPRSSRFPLHTPSLSPLAPGIAPQQLQFSLWERHTQLRTREILSTYSDLGHCSAGFELGFCFLRPVPHHTALQGHFNHQQENIFCISRSDALAPVDHIVLTVDNYPH